MKRSDLKHLRRLVAWVECEIGQSPDELVKTMRNLAERGITTDDAGKARMVQAYDAARSERGWLHRQRLDDTTPVLVLSDLGMLKPSGTTLWPRAMLLDNIDTGIDNTSPASTGMNHQKKAGTYR